MHLDLALLESFMALALERHYGRAADRRHIAAPTLSKHIQRLERQVGTPLVRRDSSGVIDLTPAGARLAARADGLLAHELMVRRVASGAVRRVVLGVPDDGEGGMDARAFSVVARLLRCELPEVVGAVAHHATTAADHDAAGERRGRPAHRWSRAGLGGRLVPDRSGPTSRGGPGGQRLEQRLGSVCRGRLRSADAARPRASERVHEPVLARRRQARRIRPAW